MADLTTEGTGSAERKSANRSACATTRMGIYGRDPITDLELYRRPPAGLLAFGTARVRTWGAAGCAPRKRPHSSKTRRALQDYWQSGSGFKADSELHKGKGCVIKWWTIQSPSSLTR